MTTFNTIQDALDAGYTYPDRRTDKDTSEWGSFGYEYKAPDGTETVAVWCRLERNKSGGQGAISILYPPK